MDTLRQRYGAQVGYSGHERRVGDVCFAASAAGAVVIERHLTLDADAWGPDHRSSLEPAGFIELVRGCRVARRSALLGSGVKVVAASETAARQRLRMA
jgi:sialic acid synthase SpsE